MQYLYEDTLDVRTEPGHAVVVLHLGHYYGATRLVGLCEGLLAKAFKAGNPEDEGGCAAQAETLCPACCCWPRPSWQGTLRVQVGVLQQRSLCPSLLLVKAGDPEAAGGHQAAADPVSRLVGGAGRIVASMFCKDLKVRLVLSVQSTLLQH